MSFDSSSPPRLHFGGPPPSAPRIVLVLFSTSHPQSPNPFGINLFADPHALTPMAPIFYKNIGRHGISRVLRAAQGGDTSTSNLQPGIVQNPVAHPPVFSITCAMLILQPFCFDGLPFSWGVWGIPEFQESDHPFPIPYSQHLILFLFTCLRTLPHSTKTQPLYFQAIPHSLPKTTRRGEGHFAD